MFAQNLPTIKAYICRYTQQFYDDIEALKERLDFLGISIVNIMDETTKLVIMMETSDDPIVYYHMGCSTFTPEDVMDPSFDPKQLIPNKPLRKRRKPNIIIPGLEETNNFENNEPVWSLIIEYNVLFIWPSIYNSDTQSAIPLFPIFKEPKILSVHKANTYNKEDIVVPDDKKGNWDEAVKIFTEYSLTDIVLTALGITTQNIQSSNKKIALENNTVLGNGYKNLERFLISSLICLKDVNSLQLEQDDSIDGLRQAFVDVLYGDVTKPNLIGLQQKTFESVKMFPPLYPFLNCSSLSEMNQQDGLSAILAFLVFNSGGILSSFSNIKDVTLSKQTRMTRHFTQTYFKTDKVLFLQNKLFPDYEWRCFYGEYKPNEYSKVFDHPDFIKILVLLRSSLKELTQELLHRNKLGVDTVLNMYGCLTGGKKLCFLRLASIPKSASKENSYTSVYHLFVSEWHDFTNQNDLAEIMITLFKISNYWFNLNVTVPHGELAYKIETTPKVSFSFSIDGEIDISNILTADYKHEVHPFQLRSIQDFETFESFKEWSKNHLSSFVPSTKQPIMADSLDILSYVKTNKQGLILIAYDTPYLYYPHSDMVDVLILFKINSKTYYIIEKISKYYLVLRQLNSNSSEDDRNNNGDHNNKTSSSVNNNRKNKTNFGLSNTGLVDLDSYGISDFTTIAIDERKIIGTGLMDSVLKVFIKLSKTMSEKIDTMNFVTTISHPNICRIYKYVHTSNQIDAPGWNDSKVTITAMEPLNCFDHSYTINSNNFECFFQKVFIGCLLGLECLHSNDIVHCDISVHNIMFRNYTEPVIIDMNNSSIMNFEFARNNLHFKPNYSPTDIKYRFTPTHDIYALAVVLIKLMIRHSRLVFDQISSYLFELEVLQSHFEFTEIAGLYSVLKNMIDCKYHSATKCLEDVNNELKKSTYLEKSFL